jgi:hypothetical protein
MLAAVSGLFVVPQRNERRLQRLYFLGAWIFLALSIRYVSGRETQG